MQVQSCCFAYSTNCFFDVLVVVAVVASYSPLFHAVRYLRPSSTSSHVSRESGLQNPRDLCLWNPQSWASESRIQLRNRTKWHLEFRIQVPLTKTGIQYLESRIPGVESRIQDCLRFPYCGAINFINKKEGPLPSRNIRLESQTKRAIYVSATELNAIEWRKR